MCRSKSARCLSRCLNLLSRLDLRFRTPDKKIRGVPRKKSHASCVVSLCVPYKGPTNMSSLPPHNEWQKGSAELLVLSLLEDQPRHGYDISKLIQLRSDGALRFHVTSLYPLLHRLEQQGSIEGRWVEKPEQRRRRYYSLTPQGRSVLRSKQKSWKDFVAVIGRITGIEHA
jgi:PadR family transcriptional regulator, regulatory protein PadR